MLHNTVHADAEISVVLIRMQNKAFTLDTKMSKWRSFALKRKSQVKSKLETLSNLENRIINIEALNVTI